MRLCSSSALPLFLSQLLCGSKFPRLCASRSASFALGVRLRGRDEFAFQIIHLLGMRSGPFARLRQACTTIQHVRLTVGSRPFLGGLGELPVEAQAFAVVFEPAAQTWATHE